MPFHAQCFFLSFLSKIRIYKTLVLNLKILMILRYIKNYNIKNFTKTVVFLQ